MNVTNREQNLEEKVPLNSLTAVNSVRNSLQSSGGPIGPQGSEVQWPLLKLDGPNFLKTN